MRQTNRQQALFVIDKGIDQAHQEGTPYRYGNTAVSSQIHPANQTHLWRSDDPRLMHPHRHVRTPVACGAARPLSRRARARKLSVSRARHR
jgi:hypothetical protein